MPRCWWGVRQAGFGRHGRLGQHTGLGPDRRLGARAACGRETRRNTGSWRKTTAPGDVLLWGKNTREQVWGILTFLRAASRQSGPPRGTGQWGVQGLGLGGHGEAGTNAQQTQRAVSPCGRERGEPSRKDVSPPRPPGSTAPLTLVPPVSAVPAARCAVVPASRSLIAAPHTVPTHYLTAKPPFGRTTLCKLPQPAGSTRTRYAPCRSLAHLSKHVHRSPAHLGWLLRAVSLPKGRVSPSLARTDPASNTWASPHHQLPVPSRKSSTHHVSPRRPGVPAAARSHAPIPGPVGPYRVAPKPSPASQPPHGRDGGWRGAGRDPQARFGVAARLP